jgi:acetyl esterase
MRSGSRTLFALVAGVAALGALVSCSADPAGDQDTTVTSDSVIYPLSLRYHGIDVVEDVPYGRDPLQRMDVCLPADSPPGATATPTPSAVADGAGDGDRPGGAATAGAAADVPGSAADAPAAPAGRGRDRQTGGRPAVMMVHGGSWSHGDKSTAAYRSVCQYLASEGFVTFNVDYRLAPTDPFPAGLDDVRSALDAVFRTSTLQTYDVDPDRVGLFGGSAGGNLVAMLAVEDHESAAYGRGDRIRAVVDLSGPTDLTVRSTRSDGVIPAFQRTQLLYLGCASYTECPAAERASPEYHVTRATAPFFIGHSTHEFIPLWESQTFATTLRAHGVPVTFVAVRGSAHSIAQLDEAMSRRVSAWLRGHLR